MRGNLRRVLLALGAVLLVLCIALGVGLATHRSRQPIVAAAT